MMKCRTGEFRHSRISVVLSAFGLAVASPAAAATLHVPADFPAIQAAVDASNSGDEVLVAPGQYTGAGNKNVDLHQKDIVVRSESGADVTIIDCEGSGRGFVLFGNYPVSTRIEGFTIQNGNGNAEPVGGGAIVMGGGAATIKGCVFRNNIATSMDFGGGGGGLVCHSSSSLIEDCDFIQNTVVPHAGAVGGGMASHEGRPTIRRCRFIENFTVGGGGGGGGLYVHYIASAPEVLIEECEFVRNRGPVDGGAAIVGGIVRDCRVEGNEASSEAGGIAVLFSTMERCVIHDNTCGLQGGGFGAFGAVVTDCEVMRNKARRGGGAWEGGGSTIERCLIYDNEADLGGGLYCNSRDPSSFVRCTFVRNHAQEASGIAVSAGQPVTHHMDGSIIAGGINGPAIACLGGATLVLTCSDLFGNEGGDWVGCVAGQQGQSGNFSADPYFCDEAVDNFALAESSPCLPGNHPQGANCGVIGAKEAGCAVAVEATTWGRIKARSSILHP
jgi:hypothetical protein